ncbi:hypothetical protein ABB37_08671 [Leptomonas pyrrhocoris]|uniref:Enkurin domain-containing protein n=1 Tax=Leptomonas pyrrhocoris TaxID=157538 RepID=A0A0M9FT43_LEPPY|nr:hypothetical protein ABB37_08671 [Leptomonas pyrrhocoris]KPA75399.1 hypothetical protein ABB37_08671 [Leptomonas pyrrhocoris]|eukprot:XP_015653838.1 hypothetical protein ABB37_08671 [Leptomonas pyrrhocoris]
MSGESIYGLYAKSAAAEKQPEQTASPYTGKYEKHLGEPTKPVYSTFFEKGKEYDGTNVRFFKQREAVIGKNVGDSVAPQNYLKKGGGVHYVVPPVHEEKLYCKPPLDENFRQAASGDGADGSKKDGEGGDFDENGMPRSGGYGSRPNEGTGSRPNNGFGSPPTDAGGSRPTGADGEGLDRGEGMQQYGGVEYDENGNPLNRQQGVGSADANDGYGASRDATKNFVASNIVEVSNLVPKRRKQQAPLATSRKSFGQNPAYLSRVKGEVAQEKAFVQSLEETKLKRQQQAYSKFVYLLSREEHEKLVADLKARHDECMSEMQKMPFSKDTPSMRKRRTELERTIADIEAALKKLDKDALFIYKDDPVNGQWAKEAALKEAQKYAAELL